MSFRSGVFIAPAGTVAPVDSAEWKHVGWVGGDDGDWFGDPQAIVRRYQVATIKFTIPADHVPRLRRFICRAARTKRRWSPARGTVRSMRHQPH